MPTRDIRLAYGLQGEELKQVDEVARGLACDCVCPGCRAQLVARQGSVMQHHFAHQGDSCTYGVESALHLAAKEIIAQNMRITLPTAPSNDSRSLIGSPDPLGRGPTTYQIDNVALEHRTEDLVPDLVLHIQERPLLIEITVTHGIDVRKYHKILSLGISTLEINLSKEPRTFTRERLREIVIDGISHKRWIYNAYSYRRQQQRLRQQQQREKQSKRKVIIRRGYELRVDYCPIKSRTSKRKSYANIMTDCQSCPHMVMWGAYNNEYAAEDPGLSSEMRLVLKEAPAPEGAIYCDGHL